MSRRKGNYSTKAKAQAHAAKLRKHFARMKPIRVVKCDVGWDVITTH